MSGVGVPPSESHSGTASTLTPVGCDVPGDEVGDMEHHLDLSQSQFLFNLSPLELNSEETQQVDGSWSQDGDLGECGHLERRWVLWHEFMKEHDQLDAWLRLAEQAVSSPNSIHVTYMSAKEELRKFERLRREAGSQLAHLDSLTLRNRTLNRLFQGAMQARLLASARECGRRWDDMNAKLESVTGQLQLLVSEWEAFEAQREELALWLANMDVRLTEVDHLAGNTCEKLRQLQSFQESVCVNSGRMNALLRRGEALIQHSEPTDAQHIESQLLELLRHCSHVYNNIGRTHTRLLSMRLVFEDNWILSQAPDSGCPSESLLEDEGTVEKHNQELSASSTHSEAIPTPACPSDLPSPLHHPPPPSSPTHEHLGLEWDPSVDIGRSVSRDDADSSYFSASTGLCHRDGLKRRSFLSSYDSQSDISADIGNHEADLGLEEWLDHPHPDFFSPVTYGQEDALLCRDEWKTSTPERQDGEPVGFDGGRVKEWLGVQSSAPPERSTSCSKAVQTDGQVKCYMDVNQTDAPNQQHLDNSQHRHDDPLQLFPSPSHDLKAKASSDWMRTHYHSKAQEEEELHCCGEAEHLVSRRSVHRVTSTSSSSRASSSSLLPTLLFLLLAAALTLLACLTWVLQEPPCHHSNRMHRTYHLTLNYVNGPPPT